MLDDSYNTAPSRYQLTSAIDGHPIEVLKFIPAQTPTAAIHIIHGMAEHIDRYTHFAEYLCRKGFLVVTHSHRGHGQHSAHLGHFSDYNGWEKVLSDLDQVYRWIREKQHLPVIMLGHSMGSFLAQAFCARFSPKLAGLVLSGSNYQSSFTYSAARFIARLERFRVGRRNSSLLLNALTFGGYNRKFKPHRTQYDWLSRDSFQVDVYCQDKLCGFDCTTQFWMDFLGGLADISKLSTLKRIDHHLPILILGGNQDPVGRYGKGLVELERKLNASGHQNTHLLLYPGGRHEMLNESNRDEVYEDISHWISEQVRTTESVKASNG